MSKLNNNKKFVCLAAVIISIGLTGCDQKIQPKSQIGSTSETIRIAIGTQDTTINCATGGLLIRELDLLPKYLPKDAEYENVKYDIQWKNFTSGAPLTSEMVAERLDIGAMGEFPAVNNFVAFQKMAKRSLFINPLSGSTTGSGNAIVVPTDSTVNSIENLKGQTISVPFASSAHGLLLRVINEQGWVLGKDITVIAQTPEIAGPSLKSKSISAHADFVPFGELFAYQGFARKIYDGSQAKIPTFHGTIVRHDFAAKHPRIITAYLQASIEADQRIQKEPEKYSQLIADKTGVPAEVVYLFHGPLGLQTRDFTWKKEYRQATQQAVSSLKILGKNDIDVDVNQFIQDTYIKEAFKASNLDYSAALNNYGKAALIANDALTGKPITSFKYVTQVWVSGEEKVRSYASIEHAFRDMKTLQKEGKQLRVVYSQDFHSDIKMLSNLAWFATNQAGKIHAFLLQSDAQDWAKKNGGQIYDFKVAQQLVK
ncbi:NitT/TauT family transport system substrate-binding protein [Acinetobacter calcoaceticus]|uniref:Putative aliphatic sulfonates-binding protein n=1 Tax=Acinetobacter calcoaceticus TaxID=471 RepID=A0A4R1XGU8_ACICA|nr:NitT/TauT family transport system substrate-binding protein [Acinetobacter calcoaceticus]